MATIHADTNGNILRMLLNSEDERLGDDPPAETTQTVIFDHYTNPDLVETLIREPERCAVGNDTLLIDGSPATVNPDGFIANAKDALRVSNDVNSADLVQGNALAKLAAVIDRQNLHNQMWRKLIRYFERELLD